MDTERGIDVLIVVAGWDTIELNSVDVVCRERGRVRISSRTRSAATYMRGADVWLLLSIRVGFE